MPTSVLNVAAKSALPSQSTVGRVVSRIPEAPRNVGPAERVVSIALGGGLALSGLLARRIDPIRLIAGAALVYRGVSGHCPVKSALSTRGNGAAVIPARTGVRIEHSVLVARSAEDLYRAWRTLSDLPRFMSHIREVREIDANRSHWVARGPLGLSVEWDAELITDTPNEVISWRSLPGSDIDTAGSVHFIRMPNGPLTEVRVNLKYDPPAGIVGDAAAALFGSDPRQQIREDLARFRQIMEQRMTNDPVTHQ